MALGIPGFQIARDKPANWYFVKTVLIIDHDLGFVFWLGHILDLSGYEALPARSVPDAVALLQHFRTSIDLVILNPSLPDTTGFVMDLREAQPDLKVIALLDQPADELLDMTGIDAVECKPSLDEFGKHEWLQFVKSVLSGNTVRM